MKQYFLDYDRDWQEKLIYPINTLQLFITNKCNLRCNACFYKMRLGRDDMTLRDYKKYLNEFAGIVKKIILIGGEPTLHKNLSEMIAVNQNLGFKTTIYTNGYSFDFLKDIDLTSIDIRVSIYGVCKTEKPIIKISKTDLPIMFTYMLRKDNVDDLFEAAKMAEEEFNCKRFFISSIRDIAFSGNYWKDTSLTLPLQKYFEVIQDFVRNYRGKMELHIAKRGVILTEKSELIAVAKCRFGNIFPNGDKIICPFDICKNITVRRLRFNERKCNKHNQCLLRKVVLTRI